MPRSRATASNRSLKIESAFLSLSRINLVLPRRASCSPCSALILSAAAFLPSGFPDCSSCPSCAVCWVSTVSMPLGVPSSVIVGAGCSSLASMFPASGSVRTSPLRSSPSFAPVVSTKAGPLSTLGLPPLGSALSPVTSCAP